MGGWVGKRKRRWFERATREARKKERKRKDNPPTHPPTLISSSKSSVQSTASPRPLICVPPPPPPPPPPLLLPLLLLHLLLHPPSFWVCEKLPHTWEGNGGWVGGWEGSSLRRGRGRRRRKRRRRRRRRRKEGGRWVVGRRGSLVGFGLGPAGEEEEEDGTVFGVGGWVSWIDE